MQTPSIRRQFQALAAARVRLDYALSTGDPEQAFAPVGETLAWIYAIAGGRPRCGDLLDGLKHARDRVLHGEPILVADRRYHYGSELPFIVGRAVLGTVSGWRWEFARLPEPTQSRYRPSWLAYLNTCAGQLLTPVLDEATGALERLSSP